MTTTFWRVAQLHCLLVIMLFSPLLSLAQVLNRSGEDSTVFISHTVFVPKYAYPSGDQNWSVATGDMNRDGKPDIITGSKLDGKINVHFNDGGGGFEQMKSYPAQKHNRAICAFDANEDGWTDIASVTMLGKLCILLNDQKGGLGPARVFQVGTMAHDINAADLNGDGHLDLAIAVVSLNALKVHYGDGKGNFREMISLPTGRAPRSVEVGDIDQDGDPDLVAGCDDGRVYIHLNEGNKTFRKQKGIRSGLANWGLGLADFNGDGLLDIASASYHEKLLCIHLNQGNLLFEREQCVIGGDHNFDLTIGDFDLDGDPDVVTCSTLDKSIGFHLNDGTGVMGERNELGSGDWNASIAQADFDGDGDLDVVSASIKDSKINVHRNISIDPSNALRVAICVKGKVYNGDTEELLPKVQISLQNEDGEHIETQLTSKDGAYSFCPPVNHTYYLVVRAPDLPVHRESFDMPDTNLVHDVYIFKPTGTYVYGKVKDAETFEVLAQATVKLYRDGGEPIDSVKTNDRGAYRYKLPFGYNYEVNASTPGYDTQRKFFDLTEENVKQGRRVDLFLNYQMAPSSTCVSGLVRDEKTEEPIAGATIVVRDSSGLGIQEVQTDELGQYRLCLPFGNFEFNTSAPGYFFNLSTVELALEKVVEGQDHEHNIDLQPLEEGAKVVLKNIYYDVDKATLREESIAELDRLLQVMNENPTLLVEISGHTDSDASDQYNEVLSQNRAQSVVDYMLESGIEVARMKAKGYGESQPVAPNDSKENKQLNRRTEFKVLGWQDPDE
jgi:outer membrane protein OmpA-like peptidoglycan-associated protein